MMETAPLFLKIAEAPPSGKSYWINVDCGPRIRVGAWINESAKKGTVLIFPGRSEYIEKYGRMITETEKFGFNSYVVDWRGQGLSDRLSADPMTGHVDRFSDYHRDVAAIVDGARSLELPKPWFLIGHSLGACIGLRAIVEGLPVSACAFTGPMWNINLPPLKRMAAWPVSWAAQRLGLGRAYAPGTNGSSYVLSTLFEDNRLTGDQDMYQYFVNQAKTLVDHQIGGPSLGWLFQILKETRAVAKLKSPDVPCITFCGDQDKVVDIPTVKERMAHWPTGKLELIPNGKHDLFSEGPQIRQKVMADIFSLFCRISEGQIRQPDHQATENE